MKKSKTNEELRSLSLKELEQKLEESRREMFTLRINAMTAHVKDYSQFTKLRRQVARISTHVRQKEAAAA